MLGAEQSGLDRPHLGLGGTGREQVVSVVRVGRRRHRGGERECRRGDRRQPPEK
jgi:hypothetical protein